MPTKLIRSLYNINAKHWGGVLTIGNFDGVHIGHQQLIASAVKQAKELGKPSIVITFEPHAFEFFAKDGVSIPRLTRFREKFCALSACGADYVLILPFNQSVASLSATDFVTRVIYDSLHPQHIVVGDDFRFGRQRQGNFLLLTEMGKKLGFTVQELPTVLIEGERVSSTRVRKALAEGNHALVKRLLGQAYTMMGRVRRGDQKGRVLGFPTANITLHRKLTPLTGVYTVLMHGLGSKALPGVANIGTRPTVDGSKTLLEVHLLDFNQDIYGRYVQVEFCEKLRDEMRFPNLDSLKEQIAKDAESAREYFNKNF